MIQRPRYTSLINTYLDTPLVKVITGLRRSGKSTLLTMTMEHLEAQGVPPESLLHINMESLHHQHIRTAGDLHAFVLKHCSLLAPNQRCYLFVDEIQEIENWEQAITSLLVEKKIDITITGSNAHLLSSELATFLTGRYVTIAVYPLSFAEFIDITQEHSPTSHVGLDELFELYFRFGGLPGIHALSLNEDVVMPHLNDVFSSILYKDVVRRHHIRDVAEFERITAFILDNVGKITTIKRITDYLQAQRSRTSFGTVQQYVHHLAEAFLAYRVQRYDLKGKQHLALYDKYYLGDIAFRHARLGNLGADRGRLLENIVYLELLRRGYQVSVGVWEQREVDFVAEKGGENLYIQVAYLLADDAVVEREFGSLELIPDNYPKLVLSLDRNWGKGRNGIEQKYLVDFLLEDSVQGVI